MCETNTRIIQIRKIKKLTRLSRYFPAQAMHTISVRKINKTKIQFIIASSEDG